jgi:hypothetical protein
MAQNYIILSQTSIADSDLSGSAGIRGGARLIEFVASGFSRKNGRILPPEGGRH